VSIPANPKNPTQAQPLALRVRAGLAPAMSSSFRRPANHWLGFFRHRLHHNAKQSFLAAHSAAVQLPLRVFCVCQKMPLPSGSVRSGQRKLISQYGPNTVLKLLVTSSSRYLCTPVLTSYAVCPRVIKFIYSKTPLNF